MTLSVVERARRATQDELRKQGKKYGAAKYPLLGLPKPSTALLGIENAVLLGLSPWHKQPQFVAGVPGSGIIILHDSAERDFKIEISQVAGPD